MVADSMGSDVGGRQYTSFVADTVAATTTTAIAE